MNIENFENQIDEIEKFFDDVDDGTFILVVRKFNFFIDSASNDVNNIFDKFLEEMGISDTWPKFRKDHEEPGYFRSCPTTTFDIIDNIRTMLFIISFNRFRRITAYARNHGEYLTSTKPS